MIKCDNCSTVAAYTCADPGLNPINYCLDCLPVWLQARAAAGHFPLIVETTVEEAAPQDEAPVTRAKKKAAPSDANN